MFMLKQGGMGDFMIQGITPGSTAVYSNDARRRQ